MADLQPDDDDEAMDKDYNPTPTEEEEVSTRVELSFEPYLPPPPIG